MNGLDSDKSLPANWMSDYKPPEGFYDEFIGKEGTPRPHWRKIARGFSRIDPQTLASRGRQLDRLIQDNGITYNVYGDESDNLRPWTLDMMPLAMSTQEFKKLESALSQRAHLLNLVLQDIYGRQTMLQNSKMHPFLVFSNPAFLRPCHGLLPPQHSHLHLYAADISRSPDGNWWVLADRVEAASGLGYAIENRMLMSRIFPRIIREAETQSLQPFIQEFCRHIESLAPQNTDNPNIALLTAGPRNETYFEQSFLARNLGYSLVEGADLTVRANRLYMKTIGGVQPVDALLRRVDSSWCDPLELRNESLLGIPGLVNAVRKGNVSVANALGSGFVETTAMHAFLPWFCRNFLGENLDIPSVATWWCGEPKELDYVIENLERLAIKPTFWGPRSRSYFGPLLSASEKDALIRNLRATPEAFCAQEIVSNGTIPIHRDGTLQSRHFQLRVFLIPDGNSWRMMPGGLARYASQENDLIVSMQRGGESKDTWVLRDNKTQSGKSIAPNIVSKEILRRNSNDLPSRVAENLFWLGRYIERTESQARLLRALNNLLVDQLEPEGQKAIFPFLKQIVEPDYDLEDLTDSETSAVDFGAAEEILVRAAFDRTSPESLVSNLDHIERTASRVKERLSVDIWKRLFGMQKLAVPPSGEALPAFDEDLPLLLDQTLDDLASFVGNLSENMTRSQGWRFMQIGRRLERGLAFGFLLRNSFEERSQMSETLLSSLLDWSDSSITYRRRYLNALQEDRVLDLLCFDASNPRSLAFQVESLRQTLGALPHSSSASRHPIDTDALRLYSRLGLGDPAVLLKQSGKPIRAEIATFFEAICDDLQSLSSKIEQTYFAHTALAPEKQAKSFIG